MHPLPTRDKQQSQKGGLFLATHVDVFHQKSAKASPLTWYSKKIDRVVASTLAAETYALSSAVDMADWLRLAWEWLRNPLTPWKTPEVVWKTAPPSIAVVDFKSLYDVITKNTTPQCQEHRTLIEALVIKDHLKQGSKPIGYIPQHNLQIHSPNTWTLSDSENSFNIVSVAFTISMRSWNNERIAKHKRPGSPKPRKDTFPHGPKRGKNVVNNGVNCLVNLKLKMKFWECDFNLCHMVLPESIRVPATICHAWLPKGSPHIMPMCTFAGHRARGGCTTGCDPKVKRIAFPAAGVFWEP